MSTPSTIRPAARRAARPPAPPAVRAAVAAALGFGLAGAAVRAALPDARALWEALLGLAVLVPFAVAVGAGLRGRRETLAWAGVGCGLVLTGVAAQHGMPSGHGVPPDGVAAGDVLWLVRYPLLYGALALLVAARSPGLGVRPLLDGLIGAFAAGGLFELLVRPWMEDGARVDGVVAALRGTYPLLDVLVLGFLGGAAVMNGWPMRIWLPLVLDIALLTAGEVLDTRAAFRDPGAALGWATYPIFLASGWCLTVAIFTLQETRRGPARPAHPIWPSVLLAAAGVGTLAAASPTDKPAATALGAAALLAALARQWLTHADNARLLARSRSEARTDALTGLRNRRALTADLAAAARVASRARPLTLALYDLDGFKHYNDTFGHPAGDALLHRLGNALDEAVQPEGRAYRMGGDEFCVLATGPFDHGRLVKAGRRALADRGEGFVIGASAGVAALPGDARDATDLLRIADHRMYAEKGSAPRRRIPAHLTATAALLQIVRERDPALGDHTQEVAAWAAGVASALGADAVTIEHARLGGELHDIGKTAIPDAILSKPGPLTADEWTFMRRHTVIGERILLADAALAQIGPVARSHHERWDGGGYPDGLVGEEIPLAARIVAVCDAYQAMIADRPYRAGRDPEAAIGELLACSGAQFDPAVVDAFVGLLAPQRRPMASGAPS